MKKVLTAMLAALTLIASSATVSADHYWSDAMNFTAAEGAIDVDGKITPGEWDDAQLISIKLNNDPLDASGNINYQSGWADVDRDDADYSGTYRIKWDANYIYFLEDRSDDFVNQLANADEPWTTDGTLIFTQVDSADGSLNPEGISAHIFYSVGDDGVAGSNLKARVADMSTGFQEKIDIPGGKIASGLKSGGFVVEVAVPWSFYSSIVPGYKGPVAGDKLGLSYVIHDSDTEELVHVKQLCYAIDNENMGEVPGGYDYGGWATLELLAAPVAPATEAPTDAPEATDVTPVTPVTPTAPKTADSIGIILAAMVLAAGFVVVTKRTVKSK
ncbi:hypothetical protein FACS1894105_04920 [Clostridia bacterium]|nr:hypothetical protein FACS1894105_04920 [Clostridia bacterium]